MIKDMIKMSVFHDRRLGKFRVSTKFINTVPEILKMIFSEIIVLQATNDFIIECVDYIGVCNKFRELSLNEVIPEYRIDIHQEVVDDVKIYSFTCVEIDSLKWEKSENEHT
jgi:hypothetical protein